MWNADRRSAILPERAELRGAIWSERKAVSALADPEVVGFRGLPHNSGGSYLDAVSRFRRKA
ncbi:MAG: hypothetical protein EDS66_07960 [Planctomycetota bacterium]|nr:MAG: hypothetical protein EDS66_07960 [Planctomycetota bacterium]MCQ3921353.1 hypothetical protein [Planctomycetota bacterium]